MRVRTKLRLFVLCSVLIAAALGIGCTSPASVQEPSEPAQLPKPVDSAPSKTIYLVGEQEFAPISFEKDGKVTGINVDIIKEAFKRMDIDVKLELMPWERCKQMALDGTADGFFSPYKTPEREQNYLFVGEPMMIEKNVLAVAKNSTIEFDGDMKKMSQYTFGILIGYATLEQYQSEGIITKIDESHTAGEALKKLTAGRGIDIYVNTDMIIKYTANQEGLSNEIKILETPFTEIPSHIAFTKARDMSDLAARFETELKKIKADGTYERIIESYVGQ